MHEADLAKASEPTVAHEAQVAVESSDGQSRVSLSIQTRYDVDLELVVDVSSQGFSCRQTVMIHGEELTRFLSQLEAFPGRRSSGVELSSISPEKFRFSLMPLKRKGLIIVQVLVQRHGFWGEPRFAQSLAIAFELAPDRLPALYSDFQAFSVSR